MDEGVKVDIEIVKAFASAAIRAVKEQCAVQIRVDQPFYRKEAFPTAVDVASFIDLETPNFRGSLALCYPRATFLAMIKAMTGETHALISASVRDGAGELLNIVYGEVKTVFNNKGYALPMAIPQILLADAAIEKLSSQEPSVIVPFHTQHGQFFAQIGIPKAAPAPVRETKLGMAASDSFPPESRILVVDDMSTMRKVVRRTLNGLGYGDVTEADDGTTAWAEILKACQGGKPFDLILSDWNMPVMKGIDLLKKVRANVNIRKTPLILITAESEMSQIMSAVSLGASGYILKPFTTESVAAKLKEAYHKHSGSKKAA